MNLNENNIISITTKYINNYEKNYKISSPKLYFCHTHLSIPLTLHH
jgi:hypothetical protein